MDAWQRHINQTGGTGLKDTVEMTPERPKEEGGNGGIGTVSPGLMAEVPATTTFTSQASSLRTRPTSSRSGTGLGLR